MLRHLLQLASPAGPDGRLSVLILHRVLPKADPLFPQELHARSFDELCGWARAWFTVLPLDVAVEHWANRRLPPRALAITFDDGYADNHAVALPILQRHGLTATFFIATGFLDGGRMWNDTVIEAVRAARNPSLNLRDLNLTDVGEVDVGSVQAKRRAITTILAGAKYLPVERRQWLVEQVAARAGATLPDDLMMRSDQVRSLHKAGMTIGAHTVSHPILARLSDDEARAEMRQSKQALEDLLGQRVGLFAYPNGKPGQDYTPVHADMARDLGFDAAVSTAWGAAAADSARYELPRFTPWDRTRLRFGLRMLQNLRSGSH